MSSILNPTHILSVLFWLYSVLLFLKKERKSGLQALSRLWKLPWGRTEPAAPRNPPEFMERLQVSLKLTVTLEGKRGPGSALLQVSSWLTQLLFTNSAYTLIVHTQLTHTDYIRPHTCTAHTHICSRLTYIWAHAFSFSQI